MESQIAIYDALFSKGSTLGLKDLGHRGYGSLRLEAGLGLWRTDFATTSTPTEAGLAPLLSSTVDAFIGREAPRLDHTRCLVRLEIASTGADIVDPWGSEPVFSATREVGLITSGGFSPSLECSLAMATVDSTIAHPGTHLEVEILGERRAAVIVPGTRAPTTSVSH